MKPIHGDNARGDLIDILSDLHLLLVFAKFILANLFGTINSSNDLFICGKHKAGLQLSDFTRTRLLLIIFRFRHSHIDTIQKC